MTDPTASRRQELYEPQIDLKKRRRTAGDARNTKDVAEINFQLATLNDDRDSTENAWREQNANCNNPDTGAL